MDHTRAVARAVSVRSSGDMFSLIVSPRRLQKRPRLFSFADHDHLSNTLFHAAALGALVMLLVALRLLVLLNLHIASPSNPPPLAPHRSFVAISVDDFGRFSDSVPLQPDSDFIRNNPHLQLRTSPEFRPWYSKATVETSDDLRRLSDAISKLNANVSFEQKVVLTPHWIVGGPDFDAMRAAGCRPSSAASSASLESSPKTQQTKDSTGSEVPTHSMDESLRKSDVTDRSEKSSTPKQSPTSHCVYKERLLSHQSSTGAEQPPFSRGDLRHDYLKLWRDGIWHPEYHGRSHFNVGNWLRLLETDPRAQICFDHNLVCATDPTQLRSEFTGFESISGLTQWLQQGVDAFSAFFGYQPKVMSSPHNAWHTALIRAAAELGFVGAELAEDQEAYLSKSGTFGLHDRYRFDVFFPGFDCDRAISEVTRLLQVPGPKTWSDIWYDFLSTIDMFRVHYRPYHHSPGGNHERFMSLMWHAQNVMSSTYSEEEYSQHTQCMQRAVNAIRHTLPRTVFVTGSELHQIRQRGWSVETWSDSLVIRNYATTAVTVPVPDLSELQRYAQTWHDHTIVVEYLSGSDSSSSSSSSKNIVGADRGHGDDHAEITARVQGNVDTASRSRTPLAIVHEQNQHMRQHVSVGDALTVLPDTVVRLSLTNQDTVA